MTSEERLTLAVELIEAIRERRIAKLDGLGGYRNDRLRQQAYRWAGEKGAVHIRTFRELAERCPKFKPLTVDFYRTTSVLLVAGYGRIASQLIYLRSKEEEAAES